MNAKVLYAATLGLALFSGWVIADETISQAAPQAEARAEPAAAAAAGGPRRILAEASPAAPGWVSTVAQWRVREEARTVVRRGGRREAEDGQR